MDSDTKFLLLLYLCICLIPPLLCVLIGVTYWLFRRGHCGALKKKCCVVDRSSTKVDGATVIHLEDVKEDLPADKTRSSSD